MIGAREPARVTGPASRSLFVATGATHEHAESEMRDAITFHIEGLQECGQPVPEPSQVTATYVNVAA